MTTVTRTERDEAFIDEDITPESIGEALYAMCQAIAEELWDFEWKYAHNRGETVADWSIEFDDQKVVVLRGTIYTYNNEDEEDEIVHPLSFFYPISSSDPREQIRETIHSFLCHEADEQMWFNGERPYYPH